MNQYFQPWSEPYTIEKVAIAHQGEKKIMRLIISGSKFVQIWQGQME